MIAVIAALLVSWLLTRHLPIMPVVTALAVMVFGVLTFVFQDKSFIQIKLTIVDCLFGAALLGGLALGKLLLPVVFDSVMHLDEAGWRKLTIRWGLFFFALAGLNEILRHSLDWDNWVKFKTFGVLPLTVVFALAADAADSEARDQAGGGYGAFLMPTVFQWNGFKFFFFSNEGAPREPIHIHVRKSSEIAKFWLAPVSLASSEGFDARTLRELTKIVEDHAALIERAWHEHFG